MICYVAVEIFTRQRFKHAKLPMTGSTPQRPTLTLFVRKWRDFLTMAPILGVVAGSFLCWPSLKNLGPVSTTLTTLIALHPEKGWYATSDCYVDFGTKLATGGSAIGYGLRTPHDLCSDPVQVLWLVDFPGHSKPNGLVRPLSPSDAKKLDAGHVLYSPSKLVLDSTKMPDWRAGILFIVGG